MPDNKISRTILQYREMSQLQEYAQAQETTILQISKKIQKYEDQIKHLEELLKTTVPTISSQLPGVKINANSDAEYICVIEIAKLKNRASLAEDVLTLEESRKLDTYYKILNNINSKPNKVEKDAEQLPTENLLQIVESKNDSGN